MQPADALAYGIIDGVVTPEKKVRARLGHVRASCEVLGLEGVGWAQQAPHR